MKKLAIFVEGQTDRIFVYELLKCVIGSHSFFVVQSKIIGGNKKPKIVKVVAETKTAEAEYEIIIYDCGGDEGVVTRIREDAEKLKKQGYTNILGIRDYYSSKMPLLKLKNRQKALVANLGIPVKIIIIVMEIETWFLAEITHFERVHSRLTVERIKNDLGIELPIKDVRDVLNPTKTLKEIYQLVHRPYSKRGTKVKKTIEALDLEIFTKKIRYEIEELNKLITYLENFMDS